MALTLGLGVGANLAIVALLSDIFFPATPYREPSRGSVMVENTGQYFFGGGVPEGLSNPQLSMPDDVQSGQQSCPSYGGFKAIASRVLTGGERPRAVCRIFVTLGLFEALGPTPASGRLLGSRISRPARTPVALVTDGLWPRRRVRTRTWSGGPFG